MKTYIVSVIFDGKFNYKIKANNKEEAKEIALSGQSDNFTDKSEGYFVSDIWEAK